MKQSTIFCGNLNYMLTEADLKKAFEPFGQVDNIRIIKDEWTGQGKGFAFVDMSEDDAARAVAALDGTELWGRVLRCRPADERRPRRGR